VHEVLGTSLGIEILPNNQRLDVMGSAMKVSTSVGLTISVTTTFFYVFGLSDNVELN